MMNNRSTGYRRGKTSPFERRRRLRVETLEDRRLLAAMADGTETLVNNFTTSSQQTAAESRAVDGNAAGEFAVAFDGRGPDGRNEIYVRRFDATSTPVGSQMLVNVTTVGAQRYPSVAMGAGGETVVAWSGRVIGDDDGIGMRLFDNTGTAVSGEIRVNQTTNSAQRKPVVAKANDGSFIVVWSGKGVGDVDGGVFARRYAANGVPLTGEFRVNTTTTSYQHQPDVAYASDGSFVIAWSGIDAGSAEQVFFQRFDSAGVPVGPETQVNTTLGGTKELPSVGIDGANNFLIVWNGQGVGDSHGVFGQWFNASGVPVGAETLINTTTFSYQTDASVGMAPNGVAVVTWTSMSQDGDARGVFGREFSAGVPIGGEFQINISTATDQRYSSVGMRGENFTVAWSGRGTQPGNVDSRGVFIQSYGRNLPPTANDDDNAVMEDNPPFTVGGDVTSNDIGVAPLTVVAVNGLPANVGVPQVATYGTGTINASGLYSYTLSNGSAIVQGLGPGQEVTDVFAYTVENGIGLTDSANLTVTVTGINDAPEFTQGGDLTVSENAGSQFEPGWAFSIDDGDSAVTQALMFNVIGNTNLGLFAAQPMISPDGTLTYTPADDTTGSATITIELQDDGGIDNGGDDTSAAETFQINVTSAPALLAAGGQGSSATSSLTQAELSSVVGAAIARWTAVGLSAAETQLLETATSVIADLADGRLGETLAGSIRIDIDAAGYGWFVDATPDDDSEFDTGDGEAAGHIDLLTVVMHELGHLLGRSHGDRVDVMAAELAVGTRSLPTTHDDVLADQTW